MSYTLIGEHKKDARANRDGYIAAMTELMENDPTIVHVDCDLGGSFLIFLLCSFGLLSKKTQ